MAKYTLRFTRTTVDTYEKTVSAKDFDAAQEKAEAMQEDSDAMEKRFDKDPEPETSYDCEIEEAS